MVNLDPQIDEVHMELGKDVMIVTLRGEDKIAKMESLLKKRLS